jgi:hypothetical protein
MRSSSVKSAKARFAGLSVMLRLSVLVLRLVEGILKLLAAGLTLSCGLTDLLKFFAVLVNTDFWVLHADIIPEMALTLMACGGGR